MCFPTFFVHGAALPLLRNVAVGPFFLTPPRFRTFRLHLLFRRPSSAGGVSQAKRWNDFASRLFLARRTNMRFVYVVVKTEPLHIVACLSDGRQMLINPSINRAVFSLALFQNLSKKVSARFCTVLPASRARPL